MTSEESDGEEPRRRRVDRERIQRTLTFWLRPEFVLRVVNRFQKVAGFDRAIALASGALTATIPLTIVTSAVTSQFGGKGTAERIIDRYELTGGGAEAVRDIFAPPTGASTSLGILGFLFLLVAVLSFTRGVQRLFEQTWELDPLSVRNTFNGLLWICGLALYLLLSGALHAVLGPQPPRALGGGARYAAVGGVPGLERPAAQRQADRAPGPAPLRRPRSGRARGLLGRRDGVRPASVQHVRHALRRDRRGLRDDLGALLSSWSSSSSRRRPAARSATSSTASGAANGPPRTRSGASGTRSPRRRGRDGTRSGTRYRSAGGPAGSAERQGSMHGDGPRRERLSSSLGDAIRPRAAIPLLLTRPARVSVARRRACQRGGEPDAERIRAGVRPVHGAGARSARAAGCSRSLVSWLATGVALMVAAGLLPGVTIDELLGRAARRGDRRRR